ncbi:MAG: glycosyltransferase family 4 protein [Verrucomicrobia bacterium]|nr:glycosyltransferase family 4 protein [Verrucomicrobiota bacterium]
MRIGLNLLYMIPGKACGSETYASGLIYGLSQIGRQHEFTVFVNRESSTWPLPKASNFKRVVCPVSATKRSRRYLYEQLFLPSLIKKYNLDLLHSLGYMTPFVLPCKSIVSIFDIVYNYPGAFSFLKKQLLRLLLVISAQRADHVLTISESSRRQIVAYLSVPPEKVTVTLLAPKNFLGCDERDWPDLASRLGIRDRYLLAFSSLTPSKNIPALLYAFAQVSKSLAEGVQLVLVGREPRRGISLRSLSNSLGMDRCVVFTGFLPDADLSQIFKHATAFVFPSLYEGFGLPILEAMAAGVPVACSNTASMPEVAGNAALFFDPSAPEGIVMALKQLLANQTLRTELVSKGYHNLKRFSWLTAAEKTLTVFEQVVSAPFHEQS